MKQSPARRGQPWPWWIAPVTAVVRPTTTVARAGHARLWQAAVVHGIGLLMVAAVAAGLAVWQESQDLAAPEWASQLAGLVERVPGPAAAPLMWAGAAVSLLVMEAGLCVLAWVAMAWGARDELVAEAFSSSLRRLWLLTPHAALLVLIGGLVVVPMQRVHQTMVRDWLATAPLEVRERVAAGEQSGVDHTERTPAGADDEPARSPLDPAVAADWQRHRAGEPWIARHAAAVALGVQWLLAGWLAVLVLRAGVARPWGARCRWPPLCEGCGNSLMGRTRAAACSECGRAVAASLGEGVRPGLPGLPGLPRLRGLPGAQKGQQAELRARPAGNAQPPTPRRPSPFEEPARRWPARREWPGWQWGRGWWRAVWEPAVAPGRFGERLRVMHPEGAPRRLLVLNALLAGALGAAGAIGVMALRGGIESEEMIGATLLGLVLAAATVGLALVVASMVGSMATRVTLSPLLPAAMQGACHLSGLVVAWVAANLALAAALAVLANRFGGEQLLAGATGWLLPTALALAMALNVAGLVLKVALLWRIVMAARFANW